LKETFGKRTCEIFGIEEASADDSFGYLSRLGDIWKGCQQYDHDEGFKESAALFDTFYISHDVYGCVALAEMATGEGFVDCEAG
jgi:hypothetical protein